MLTYSTGSKGAPSHPEPPPGVIPWKQESPTDIQNAHTAVLFLSYAMCHSQDSRLGTAYIWAPVHDIEPTSTAALTTANAGAKGDSKSRSNCSAEDEVSHQQQASEFAIAYSPMLTSLPRLRMSDSLCMGPDAENAYPSLARALGSAECSRRT